MARNVRMEDADRLSNLPDDIRSHILSFLSTKEAARTCILSTRWKDCFAFVSNLDFEFCANHQLSPERLHCLSKSFMKFVDRVLLLRNTTSIEKFHLRCGHTVDSSRVSGWLSAAISCGVRHLDLATSGFLVITLPGVLFSCRTLVTLKVGINSVLKVPNDVCLPNLKTLHLNSITFLDSLKRLVSSCINLEEMVMENCSLENIRNFNISHHLLKRLTLVIYDSFNYCVVIDAPMLVHLKYSDFEAASCSLKNLQSLVSADIRIAIPEDYSVTHDHHQADRTHFFRGIRNVQSLNLTSVTLEEIGSCTYTAPSEQTLLKLSLEFLLSCESVPDFPNLVQLKISYRYPEDYYYHPEDYYYRSLGKGLATLLRDSPELEEFDFFPELVNYLPEEVHSCLSSKLKVVEISDCLAEEDCIEMAKYFLKNAGVLEKLTIRTSSYVSETGKLKIEEELLASPRKSEQCCILIV